ncbi:hypothetical protein JL720_7098 [Aureococcus anophagefferens]|nr:hypothetical protein JL720_7098 [Aureococcus anophagefferens]
MKRLGVTALAGIARGSWVGPSDCVRDANGCCASAGFFYCGSSGRCTHDWDQCEDGLGDAPSVDYEANGSSAAKIIFNVCANAATPRACVNTTGADGAASTSPAAAFAVFDDDVDGAHERCARLSGSASRDDTFAASPLDAARPTRGVALDYAGGDVCGATGAPAAFGSTRPSSSSSPGPSPRPSASAATRRRARRSAVRCGSDTRYRTVDVTDDDDAGVEMDNCGRYRSPLDPWPDDDEEVKAA